MRSMVDGTLQCTDAKKTLRIFKHPGGSGTGPWSASEMETQNRTESDKLRNAMWTKTENDGTKEPKNFVARRTSFVICLTFCWIPWGHQIHLLFMFGIHNWNFEGLLGPLSNSPHWFFNAYI